MHYLCKTYESCKINSTEEFTLNNFTYSEYIEFFIPNEYKFDQNATDAVYDYQGGNVFEHNAEIKSYTSKSGDNITIMVGDAGSANVDLWIKNGHPLFMVNNIRGTLDEMTASGNYLYSYIKDDKMVSIYVEDPDMLEFIII